MTIKEILAHLNRILPLIGLPGWKAEASKFVLKTETSCASVEVDDIHHKIYTYWNLRHCDMKHSREDALMNVYHEALHAQAASLKNVACDIVDTYVENQDTKKANKKRIDDAVELLVGRLVVAFYDLIEKGTATGG